MDNWQDARIVYWACFLNRFNTVKGAIETLKIHPGI